MAVAVNAVIIGGNLTKDPEVKYFANDRNVCNFSLAINKKYKGKDGKLKEDVTYVDVEVWGRTADLVGQYLTKGRACLVAGSLKFDRYETKGGEKRQRLKVVADSVQFLDSKKNDDNEPVVVTGLDDERKSAVKPAQITTDDEPLF